MPRKKWTHQENVTDALLRLREKRKWQLAYRRYVMEESPGEQYAPYFGLDAATLRKWFACQFTGGLGWENFGKGWQFGHIVPTTCFDFTHEEDLRLCWSFINTRVEKTDALQQGHNRIDMFAVRPYFQRLYDTSGLSICRKMLDKLTSLEQHLPAINAPAEDFLIENGSYLEDISTLEPLEFNRLNAGTQLKDILLEREILRKFGSGPKA